MTHMSPEEFRHYGYRVVDWIVDYWTRLESFPVTPSVEPGDILRRLPAHPPEQGESFFTPRRKPIPQSPRRRWSPGLASRRSDRWLPGPATR